MVLYIYIDVSNDFYGGILRNISKVFKNAAVI